MIIVKDKAKNSKIYIQRTGGDIVMNTNNNTDVDLSDYYTKEEVDELVENVEVDLTDYYTKDEMDEIIANADSDNIITITSAEYEELIKSGNIDENTLYLITDATIDNNFKTINGETIVGSGDIQITGGTSNVALTAAEYEELVASNNIDEGVLYLITDAVIEDNFKTINGQSIIGSGNIEIGGNDTDLSDYYTKDEVNDLVNNYYTKIESDDKYVTKTYVDNQIGDINNILENIIG